MVEAITEDDIRIATEVMQENLDAIVKENIKKRCFYEAHELLDAMSRYGYSVNDLEEELDRAITEAKGRQLKK